MIRGIIESWKDIEDLKEIIEYYDSNGLTREDMREQLEYLFKLDLSVDEVRDIVGHAHNNLKNFTVSNDDLLFIEECYEGDYLKDYLSSDPYTLGMFNDWFIADCFDVPVEFIAGCQKGEQWEVIGNYMLEQEEKFEWFISKCIEVDGSGHFLNSYDGSMVEVEILYNSYCFYNQRGW